MYIPTKSLFIAFKKLRVHFLAVCMDSLLQVGGDCPHFPGASLFLPGHPEHLCCATDCNMCWPWATCPPSPMVHATEMPVSTEGQWKSVPQLMSELGRLPVLTLECVAIFLYPSLTFHSYFTHFQGGFSGTMEATKIQALVNCVCNAKRQLGAQCLWAPTL